MELKILTGTGAYKTEYIAKEIDSRLKRGDTHPLFVIVPENLVDYVERTILENIKCYSFQLNITSFNRLSKNIFSLMGNASVKVASQLDKNCLMYHSVLDSKSSLKLLGDAPLGYGQVKQLLSQVKQMKEERINPWDYEASTHDNLNEKVSDIGVIYERYKTLLNDYGYIDQEDTVDFLAERVDALQMFVECEVWIDGFSDFTQQQYAMFEGLMNVGKSLNIALCCDYSPETKGGLCEFSETLYTRETGLEEQSLQTKVKNFLQKLERWHKKSIDCSLEELIWTLFDESQLYKLVESMPNGDTRQRNLRRFIKLAEDFMEEGEKDLSNFMSYMISLQKTKEAPQTLNSISKQNRVKVTTIHDMKGLEYPVIFLASAVKCMNMEDSKKDMVVHKELGIGLYSIDLENSIKVKTIPYLLLASKINDEVYSEELRILYVAMTRSREKLIITSTDKKWDKRVENWAKNAFIDAKIPPRFLKGKTSYIDWIGQALIRHKGCKFLRDIVSITNDNLKHLQDDDSVWKIKIIDEIGERTQTIRHDESKRKVEETQSTIPFNIGQYQYDELTRLSSSISVTQLNSICEDTLSTTETISRRLRNPDFSVKKKTGAEIGTLYHHILMHLEFSKINSASCLNEQLKEMTCSELISKDDLKYIERREILKFVESELGQRISKAKEVKKEVPFTLMVTCSELFGDAFKGVKDKIKIKGVIDCFFEEDGEIVIVDYKTDSLGGDYEQKIKDRYHNQLSYYAKALEEITNKKVKETIVYLISKGKAISI